MESRGTVYIDDLKFWGYIYLEGDNVVVCDDTYNNSLISGKIRFDDIIGLHSSKKNNNITIKLDYCRYKGNTKSRIYKRIIFVYPIHDIKSDDDTSIALNNIIISEPGIINKSDDVVVQSNTICTDNINDKVSPFSTNEYGENNEKIMVKINSTSDNNSDDEWDLIDSSAHNNDHNKINQALNDNIYPDREISKLGYNNDQFNSAQYGDEVNVLSNSDVQSDEKLNLCNKNDDIDEDDNLEHSSCPYQWYDELEKILQLKKNKFLFIINPVSGQGSSYEIFCNMVEPILTNAKIEYDVVVTTLHISMYNILFNKKDTLESYDAVIGVGGDGTITDIYNGLYLINKLSIPVSCIPAGTGNGISKCITELYEEDFTPLNCLYRIIKGNNMPIDLSICEQSHDKKVISFLSQSWGMSSEVDIDSEPLRFLGSIRFTLTTLWKLVRNNNYPGILSYVDIHGNEYTVNDNFIMVWACQLPWIASDMKLSPESTFNDKCIYLLIIKEGMSRYEILNMFLKVENGSHLDITHNKFDVIPVSSYTLLPENNKSYIAIDGEKVKTEKMSVSLLPDVGYIRC